MQTVRKNVRHILENSIEMNSTWCVLILSGVLMVCECKYGYITWPADKVIVKTTDYFADIPDKNVARATYSNEINATGWAFLELHTSADFSDVKQAYAAGYLEGYLTRDLIWYHWQNMLKGYCYNKTDVCGLIEEFVDKNEAYMSEMVQNRPDDPYWYQVKLYYTQLEGLAVGYNVATMDPYQWLSTRDIIWINMLGDLDEIAFSVSMPKTGPDGRLFGDHCTGLVKLLPDLSNLYFAHSTWNSYQSMLRLHKMYVMHLHTCPSCKKLIPGYRMSLTSYPAFVQSTDDFYIISSGLATSETTIGNSNSSLFALISPCGAVLEYARAMIANRLARNGKEWTQIFRQYNSGTYNNQWFIVDYKRFKPRTSRYPGFVSPGLLWVVEQIPGYTEAADLTELLKAQTYFPSYNIPFFPRIFNLSGGNVRIMAYGDWFGYHTNPRAKILKQKQAKICNLRDMYNTMRDNDFKHDPLSRCEQCDPPYSAKICNLRDMYNTMRYNDFKHDPLSRCEQCDPPYSAKICNLRDMYNTMRYNDFKHDPLSRCEQCDPPYSACNAVSARNDLNPANGTFPFRALGHRSHGATDVKITSAYLRTSYRFLAVSSPTYNISRGIPPFKWSTFDMGSIISHVGQPDEWMFPPILHDWEWV
ncbi:hypothetical protein PYW08_007902 [Mythimna loreyi]|uniref:Uncharacterized protein n=1 Tax=Mythimna loreyi TaxID=667449 RepID=A0ACC2QI41_9NEOP|nr:hypothetical protein PYW08_007902 [Mythimna loreyi]